MSTIAVPHPQARGASDDPLIYGWRDISEVRPDGTITYKQIPLTLDDCLHPQMGDKIVESTLHDILCVYLKSIFRGRLKDNAHALVLGDTAIYWDDKSLRHHVPDVAVIFDVRDPKREFSAFRVADEGTRPSLIIEVVSPGTRVNDVERKFDHYHRARVPVYVIVDRVGGDGAWQLIGYQYSPSEYLPMPFDKAGRLWLESVDLYLGLKEGDVVLYDGATGREIGDVGELTEERDAAETRAEKAEARAEAERLRSAAAEARAEAERQRAGIEAAARAAAEARIRELEEALQRPK